MRARTVGDLRRELDGVDDGTPLDVAVRPFATADGEEVDLPVLDVERVECTPGHVVLHVDGEALP